LLNKKKLKIPAKQLENKNDDSDADSEKGTIEVEKKGGMEEESGKQ